MISKYELTKQIVYKEPTLQLKLKKLIELQPSNYKIYLTNDKFGFFELLSEINRSTPLLNDSIYTLATKIYWILNNIKNFPLCKECGKPLIGINVYSVQQGYKKQLCSKTCSYKYGSKKRECTMLEHYGVSSNFSRKEVIDKCAQTNLNKYGTKCPANNTDIQKHIRKNNLIKYGFESYSSTNECRDKVKQTCLIKYGVDNPLKSHEIQEQIKKQNIEKYGVQHPFQNNEFIKKLKLCYIEKYGENYRQILWGNNGNVGQNRRAYQYMLKSMKVIPLFTVDEYVDNRKKGENLFHFKCKNCHKDFWSNWDNGNTSKNCPHCMFNGGISKAEHEIYEFFNTLSDNISQIKTNDRDIISPLEIDIYIPEKKLAIEYDGLYWHNDDIKTDYRYHLNKTEQCEKQGIQLIHIFENEWLLKQDIVKSRLKNLLGIYDKTIFARKCQIKEVDSKLSNEFQNENHLQGVVQSIINLGLFYDDELVSLMAFSKSRFDKKYDYELVRFCNKLNYHIPGAAGKILKFFEKNYNPKSLVSYADRRWSQGKLYKSLGFSLNHISPPNYWYFKNSSIVLESRVKYQKHKLKKLLVNFNEKLTEVENMKNNNYSRIFDCGNIVFVKNY